MAARLVTALSALLMPIGAVMSLAGGQFLAAGACLLALVLAKSAWTVGRIHSRRGRLRMVEATFPLSCICWWIVA
jgi:hypothetical protein